MCDNMLYELAEEAKREISKYSDNYEIYLENTELLQLDSQKTDLNFAKEDISLGIGIRVIYGWNCKDLWKCLFKL